MAVGNILAVAGILLLLVIFAFGVVSLQHCFDACYRRRASAASSSSQSARRCWGGDPMAPLRSLPATVYRAAARPKEEDAAECAVCLAEIEDGERARFLPRCGHGFHAECVDMWLASHSTCPLCRINVVAMLDTAAPASALPPVPPQPANYAANLPVRVSDQGVVTVTIGRDMSRSPTNTAAVLVIGIPELAVPTAIPRHAVKSPGSSC